MCKNKDCFEDTCKGGCTRPKKKKSNKEDWPWYRQVTNNNDK